MFSKGRQDQVMLAAPESSFRIHFFSPNERESFSGTDWKIFEMSAT